MRKAREIGTVAELFEIVGGTTSVARQLGVGPSTASEIKRRGRIPSEYWREIIAVARKSGHPEITADLLVDLHARKSSPEAAGLAEEEQVFEAFAPGGSHNASDEGSGQFSRFRRLRRSHFGSLDEVNAHVSALRNEWDRQ